MSWAKYLEDDIEIMTDRQYMKSQVLARTSEVPKEETVSFFRPPISPTTARTIDHSRSRASKNIRA